VKPLGIRFARGSDGGAYVTRSDPRLGSTDENVQVTSCFYSHTTLQVVCTHAVLSSTSGI